MSEVHLSHKKSVEEQCRIEMQLHADGRIGCRATEENRQELSASTTLLTTVPAEQGAGLVVGAAGRELTGAAAGASGADLASVGSSGHSFTVMHSPLPKWSLMRLSGFAAINDLGG